MESGPPRIYPTKQQHFASALSRIPFLPRYELQASTFSAAGPMFVGLPFPCPFVGLSLACLSDGVNKSVSAMDRATLLKSHPRPSPSASISILHSYSLHFAERKSDASLKRFLISATIV